MEYEIIPAKYDFIFKRLFADKKHIGTLVNFLKAVLDLPDEEYASLTICDPNLYPHYKGGKRFVLDLKLETASGKIIDIEIQLCDTSEMRQRIVAYESRLIGDQLDRGDDYKDLTRVITILITDFTLLEESDDYRHKFKVRSDSGIVLTNIFEINIFELTKLPPAEDGSKAWRWLKLLTATGKEELDMLQRHYPELKEPVVRLRELSADERMREEKLAYDRACLR
jgi:predicted transposase/invertase (TIGR01784 family)